LWHHIEGFCRDFIPEHARVAPDRVTLLATGIRQFAEAEGNPKLAIAPLSDLLVKYPPTLSHLTTIHPIFLTICVATRHFTAAIPILAHTITTIDLSLSDLTYHDNLIYHYAGGIALAALKNWSAAEELFEICATSPGSAASAIQMEALKKLVLVQLIYRGKTSPPSKYMHPILMRLFKATPYSSFMNAYPLQRDYLRTIVENEQQLFANERTLGLITQAIDRAPRWAIKKLTTTYLTLHLSDIGREVGISDENEVKSLILSMIERSEISAELSADGTVSFSDPPVKFEKTDVDRVLAQAQQQDALLVRLEKEMERNREYLTKAFKSKDDTTWGPAMDEDGAFGDRPSGNWVEDMSFA
jgi:COP9 signalosome complex subunit 3